MEFAKDLNFKSSGWEWKTSLLSKAKDIITIMKKKRQNREIPIFSVLDNDNDIEEIVNDSKFFIGNESIITDTSKINEESPSKSFQERLEDIDMK